MYTRLTKKSLLWCLRFGSCTNLGQKGVNKYYPQNWDIVSPNQPLIPLRCWDNPNQEPLLIVRNHDSLPAFNPSFIDYGFNRVEWVNHLRFSGYQFSVLSQGWAFHARHPLSNWRQLFGKKSDATKGIRGGTDTRKLFDKAMKKYQSEALPGTLPACQVQENVVMKETPSAKREEKKKLIRRIKRVP
ncbi:hypothetical protein WA577_002167 [Blastocystis sp. JDR]